MKSRRGCTVGFFVLIALALSAFGLVSLGATDNSVRPSSLNSEPGGAQALYQLLQESGIPCERIFSKFDLPKDAGLVMLFYQAKTPMLDGSEYQIFEQSKFEDDFRSAPVLVRAFLGSELPSKFATPAVAVHSEYAGLSTIKKIRATFASRFVMSGEPLLTTAGNQHIVHGLSHGDNLTIDIDCGIGMLNRYIGDEDNAQFAVAVIKSILPAGKKVVFPEYAYGISSPENLFTRLGPAASSIVLQLGLIFVVLVYTLGKRFGYPDADIPPKPGSAEFVEAIGETYRRGRCTDIVLDTEYLHAIRAISRKLNLPLAMAETEKIRRPGGELTLVLQEMHGLKGQKVSTRDADDLLGRLGTHLKEFLK